MKKCSQEILERPKGPREGMQLGLGVRLEEGLSAKETQQDCHSILRISPSASLLCLTSERNLCFPQSDFYQQ